MAIKKLASARVCRPEKEEEINKRLLEVYQEVNEQKELELKRAREVYANDLAYKSRTALRNGDRTISFRLAEFAHQYVDDDNNNVIHALTEALYYNDNPSHTSLPWHSTLSGHTDAVTSVAFSPNGKRLATGSGDNTAKIWDLESGKETLTLSGHTTPVISVAFSLDGKRLATGSKRYTAKIWDLNSGKETLSLDRIAPVYSVAFSPDGKWLATGSDDDTAKIWDLESGKESLSLSGHTADISSVAFSPDGKRLATGSNDKMVKIWDVALGKEILTLSGHSFGAWSITFSPDGKRLATLDTAVKIWEFTPEAWRTSTGKNRRLSPLSFTQLESYNLEGLLDIHPNNESNSSRPAKSGKSPPSPTSTPIKSAKPASPKKKTTSGRCGCMIGCISNCRK